MVEPVIETKALRKVFRVNQKAPGAWASIKSLVRPNKKEVEAVKGVDLTIGRGEIVGFLGPNGAGKTTTLKMLSGIIHPTSGDASVLGYRPWKRDQAMLRRVALVLGNKQQLWWDLPAWDSFTVIKEMYQVPNKEFKERTEFLIETLDLKEKMHTQVRKLSLGERMKCEMVAALLYNPEIIFLDEPTLGLDVISQKKIRDFLKQLHQNEGTTMLLTSHYMQDVQELCERVVIIDHGVVFYDGTLDALADRFSDTRRLRLTLATSVSREELETLAPVLEWSEEEVVLAVPGSETAHVAAEALRRYTIQDIAISETEIEDVIRELFTSRREDAAPQVEPAASVLP